MIPLPFLHAKIPFGRPSMVGRELAYIEEAIQNGTISGGGPFMKRCEAWLEQQLLAKRALSVVK
jgi:dTDP-4-amino-4,6-dideoxygalactose transaminase